MTVPRISTMVTFRQRRCELVSSFVATHRREVAEALEQLLADGVDESEALAPGTLTKLLDHLLRRMKHALGDLVAAERKHLDEMGNDSGPRHRRDQAASELRRLLFDFRHLYRGLYGRDRALVAGFENRIAKEPLALLRQAQRVYDHLSEAPGESPDDPLYAELEVPARRMLTLLEPRLRTLRAALDEVTHELGRVQGTKVAKDRALKTFDEIYRLVVRLMVQAFRLAGWPELAARLPTSLHRRSPKRTSEESPV